MPTFFFVSSSNNKLLSFYTQECKDLKRLEYAWDYRGSKYEGWHLDLWLTRCIIGLHAGGHVCMHMGCEGWGMPWHMSEVASGIIGESETLLMSESFVLNSPFPRKPSWTWTSLYIFLHFLYSVSSACLHLLSGLKKSNLALNLLISSPFSSRGMGTGRR